MRGMSVCFLYTSRLLTSFFKQCVVHFFSCPREYPLVVYALVPCVHIGYFKIKERGVCFQYVSFSLSYYFVRCLYALRSRVHAKVSRAMSDCTLNIRKNWSLEWKKVYTCAFKADLQYVIKPDDHNYSYQDESCALCECHFLLFI